MSTNVKNIDSKCRFVIIALVAILFLASCEGSDPEIREAAGFEGLSLEFTDYPKEEIYKGSQFSFNVELFNKGFYTSDRSKLFVRSPPTHFERKNGEEVVEITNLVGTEKNPAGGFKGPYYHSFIVQDIPGGLTRQTIPFAASMCYLYKTEAHLFVCGGKPEKSEEECEAEKHNTKVISRGQGAPLAVSSIRYDLRPVEDGSKHVTSFTIELANKGTGSVFRNDADSGSDVLDAACLNPSREITNTVDYRIDFGASAYYDSRSGTSNGITCNPQKITFEDKSQNPQIICVQDYDADPTAAFTFGTSVLVPVTVTLDYIYQIGDSIQLTFRNPDS